MDIQAPQKINQSEYTEVAGVPQHTIFEVILLLAVSILFFIFVLQPKRAELPVAQANLQALQKQNDAISKDKDNLLSLINQLKTHPDDVAALDEALPLDGRITRFRLALQSLINDAGMTVGDVSVESSLPDAVVSGNKSALASPYSQTRKLQHYMASVTVSGNMGQFLALLAKLENNGRIIDVTGFEIVSSKGNNLDFRLSLQSYFYE